MNGILVLEDGRYFRGGRFGSTDGAGGEIVFNTSFTGYQEILTDPSYEGQIVILTTAHVGNYGVNPDDVESSRPHTAGLIVRDYHPVPSNWRSRQTLDDYLAEAGIPGLYGLDTRALVLHIRSNGALRGVIRSLEGEAIHSLPLAGWVNGFEQSPDDATDSEVLSDFVRQARDIRHPARNTRSGPTLVCI